MSNFDSCWLPVTPSDVVDTVLSRPDFHCTLTQSSGAVYTDRAQTKVDPACLSKLTIFHATGFQIASLENKSCANASVLHIFAASCPNQTSSLVPSVPDVSSITWQEWSFPSARLKGTDVEWQGRELPAKWIFVDPNHSASRDRLYAL